MRFGESSQEIKNPSALLRDKYGINTEEIMIQIDLNPDITIEEMAGGMQITFLKDIFSEDYLKRLGLNERQIKAVEYVKKYGSINNSIYQRLNDVGKSTATEDLQMLVEKGIFKQTGSKGRGTKYELG